MTLANIATLVRIFFIPVLVVVFYLPIKAAAILSAVIFILAALTDWLDGYLARVLNQTSAFGAFFDPVADKLLVSTALILLVSDRNLPYLSLAAFVIVGREILVSALREWMSELGKRRSIAVSYVGKVKTVIQMIAIVVLLVCRSGYPKSLLVLGYILLYIAVILTLWSMYSYLKLAWPELNQKPTPSE